MLDFKLYKRKDNHPDWDEIYSEASELVSDIAASVKLPKRPVSNPLLEKRKIRAMIKTAGNFRINRKKMAAGNHNFIPLFYIWTMTNRCNFNCTYCSDHRGNIYPELYRQGFKNDLSTAEGKRLIEIMKDSSAIYYCGGEPMLRKDLPELLGHSTDHGMFNMINTNGSLIGDLLLKPEYCDFLQQMDVIIISLDSLDIEKLSDIYVVNKKVARKTLRNILTLKILQDYVPFKLVANTVITRDNIEESNHILDWCNDLGITFSPVSANIVHEPDRELVNNPDYQKLVTRILIRAEQGYPMIASREALEKLLRVTGFSCYPVVFDHIDHDGRLFWPCKAYKDAAMINVLDYSRVEEVHSAAEKLIDPTDFHGPGPGQCGGQCAWMQNCVTDMYAGGLSGSFLTGGLLNEVGRLLK